MPPIARDLAIRIALFLLAGAVLFALLALRARSRDAAWRRPAISGGIMGALSAAWLVIAFTIAIDTPSFPVPLTARFMTNPTPDTPATVEAGRAVFQKNCVVCHGPNGRGDGPAALALNPRPLDLKKHVPLHAEGELFYWVSEGIPGSAMPAWREQLGETERWEVIRFLQTLART